jgi:hypothetical protein
MSASDVIARLRELRAKAQCGQIVGFRTRFISRDDQDQTLVNETGEELAMTYNEDTARLFAAAMNSLPALLECAEALEKLAFVAMTSGGTAGPDARLIATVAQATHALQALAEGGGE